MAAVCQPVLEIRPRDSGVGDEEQVLGVALLGGPGEVEGAGDGHALVYDDDFVMGDGVFGINEGEDMVVREEIRLGVFLLALASVHDGRYFYAALKRVYQCGGDGFAVEAVGLTRKQSILPDSTPA